MFKRQTTGSVVCASCGSLVGVQDDKCYTCGRRNPGLWGFAPLLRSLGNDLGFVQLVVWGCGALYVISLLLSGNALGMGGGLFGFLAPDSGVLFLLGNSKRRVAQLPQPAYVSNSPPPVGHQYHVHVVPISAMRRRGRQRQIQLLIDILQFSKCLFKTRVGELFALDLLLNVALDVAPRILA